MAVRLRLMRFGKRHHPFYRIVALDKRKKRDGSYLDKIGHYDPMQEPAQIVVEKEKYEYWVNRGATISEGLRKILKDEKSVIFK